MTRIDHRTHDHANTTAARQACRNRTVERVPAWAGRGYGVNRSHMMENGSEIWVRPNTEFEAYEATMNG